MSFAIPGGRHKAIQPLSMRLRSRSIQLYTQVILLDDSLVMLECGICNRPTSYLPSRRSHANFSGQFHRSLVIEDPRHAPQLEHQPRSVACLHFVRNCFHGTCGGGIGGLNKSWVVGHYFEIERRRSSMQNNHLKCLIHTQTCVPCPLEIVVLLQTTFFASRPKDTISTTTWLVGNNFRALTTHNNAPERTNACLKRHIEYLDILYIYIYMCVYIYIHI